MTTPLVISAAGVSRSYGNVKALKDVDLQVRAGETLAILGPNGAGKTTFVEILEGLRRRDEGRIEVLDTDPADGSSAWRARIGAVLQTESQSDELTVGESLSAFAGYYPSPADASVVAHRLGLEPLVNRRVAGLSGGQRRRLDLALGVIGRPELLFLDEPTTGLDPEVRRSIWSLIRDLAGDGTSIVLTTHYLEEVEQLADRVVILVDGKVQLSGIPADIRCGSRGAVLTFGLFDPSVEPPRDLPGRRTASNGAAFAYETDDPTRFVQKLMVWAEEEASTKIVNLQISQPSLEDAYVNFVNEASTMKESQ